MKLHHYTATYYHNRPDYYKEERDEFWAENLEAANEKALKRKENAERRIGIELSIGNIEETKWGAK